MKQTPCTEVKTSVSPRALRPLEAAAYIGTTPWAIEEAMRDGLLGFKIIGKARVIPVEELDKYFNKFETVTGKLPGVGKNYVADGAKAEA
jgi:hypothetical protein